MGGCQLSPDHLTSNRWSDLGLENYAIELLFKAENLFSINDKRKTRGLLIEQGYTAMASTLEDFLKKYQGCYLEVSSDEYSLDSHSFLQFFSLLELKTFLDEQKYKLKIIEDQYLQLHFNIYELNYTPGIYDRISLEVVDPRQILDVIKIINPYVVRSQITSPEFVVRLT